MTATIRIFRDRTGRRDTDTAERIIVICSVCGLIDEAGDGGDALKQGDRHLDLYHRRKL